MCCILFLLAVYFAQEDITEMKINYYSGTDEIMKELGSRIKAARIDMNITQSMMAERTNLSQRTISNLENGKDVSMQTLIEVLRVLGRVQGLDAVIPEVIFRPSQIAYDKKPRERASAAKAGKVAENTWKWGDEK